MHIHLCLFSGLRTFANPLLSVTEKILNCVALQTELSVIWLPATLSLKQRASVRMNKENFTCSVSLPTLLIRETSHSSSGAAPRKLMGGLPQCPLPSLSSVPFLWAPRAHGLTGQFTLVCQRLL